MRKSLEAITPYKTVSQDGLNMGSNLNLFGPNPVIERTLANLEPSVLTQYPSMTSQDLLGALAKKYSMSSEHFLVGNGSDEIFDLCVKGFINPGERVAFPEPSFPVYHMTTLINNGVPLSVPLGHDFTLDVEKYAEIDAPLIFIATPNNPTGNVLDTEAVDQLIETSGATVVVDEAYAEFAGGRWIEAVPDHDNLIVTRTFSKAYGLAGLRIGYAVSSAENIDVLMRAKLPFNLNVLGELVALEALRGDGFVGDCVRRTREGLEWLGNNLRTLGFKTYPSQANFLLAKSPIPVGELCDELAKRGILIRDVSGYPKLEGHVRITTGRPEHNERLVEMIRTIIQ